MADAVPLPADRAVLVLGAGTMGAGIAEVAAAAGHAVLLRDADPAAAGRAIAGIRAGLQRRVQRGRLDAAQAEAIAARIGTDADEAPLPAAGLAIEAIVEDLDAKARALGALLPRLPGDALLATNTSSLSVTALAARLPAPGRVVGMHFFNPATILPLVEVVRGQASDPDAVARIAATARAWGKVPVECASTPGFIVNRVARPFYGEALRLLLERHADPATLDAVMREAGGFRMGPCELMDLIGHDVNFAVTRSVWAGFFHDPRYQPSLVQQALVDAGWLGRKRGRGFYAYGDDAPAPVPAERSGPRPREVIAEGDLGPAHALAERLLAAGLPLRRAAGAGLLRVDGHAVALTDGRTADARSQAQGEPVALFDLALDWSACTRAAVALPAGASDAHAEAAFGLFSALGMRVSPLGDAPGLAVARTVAMLVNEAADAVQQGVAAPDDIDAAMQRGVNYPRGPLDWGRALGLDYVAGVIAHLADAHGEDRYRVSPWLRRAALQAAPAHG
ncbi:3-hydroxyacyl-CoA dehydrogenase [Luteimonas sp. Y-2-2-4F]|nr:3-hydroxyacyl-CoA dehydrogenase [Luteimonas sp. Y-2-2-4F]MCD9033182.1 3-hydroxyacyl-CoA dehydrogenase [Luteimonas sp. Y-2-2-4F]